MESNLSIPDQRVQLERLADQEGWLVTALYVEEGISAKTTQRPAFRRVLADAQIEPRPFDVVLVHNTARFARRTRDFLECEALLAQKGIELRAVSQTFAKDAGGMMSKRMTILFDEYHSVRSAVDSMRARRRMAEEGFWPGGVPPYGYRLVPAPGHKTRSHVAIDEAVSHWIELIFQLYLFGDGKRPPMGVQAIAKWLNKKGHRTRDGHRWGTQAIHRILTNSAYYGICWWNVDPSEHEFIDFGEPVAIKIPAIITEERFEAVQKVLEARDPEMGAAKADSSPLLLSKIAACKCGASMTLGTGTGKQGNTYRYYRCSADNRGLDRCSGPWIGEKTLDQAVLDVVQKFVLSEDHLQEALKGLQERETSRRAARQDSVPHLRMRFEAAEKTWKSLLEMAKLVPGL